MTLSQTVLAPHERPAVFLDSRTYHQHKNQLETPHFLNQVPLSGNVSLPLNVDSEWENQSLHDVFDVKQKAQKRRVATVQVGDALNQHPQIFAHLDLVAYAQQTGRADQVRHPIFDSDCVIVEYLKSLGYNTRNGFKMHNFE